MRFFYRIALLSIIFLFHTYQHATAAVWIEQIRGNSETIIVARNGNFLEIKEMMRLQPGDVVKVLDSQSMVRVLLGTGAIKTISKAQSPYTVAGKGKGNSFLSNLMGEVKKMLVASSDQTEAVAMMTRGRSRQLVILGVGAEENLVLAGSKSMLVSWQGGKAPFHVSLVYADNDKPVLSKQGVSQHRLKFEAAGLGEAGLIAGEYQLVVESAGTKPVTSREIALLFVDREELPEDAQKLMALGLDERVEARFLINLLHKQPEWRFFAYNLAVRHGLEVERLLLKQMK